MDWLDFMKNNSLESNSFVKNLRKGVNMAVTKITVHSNQFIVASVGMSNRDFSMATYPKIHDTYSSALHEAQRLAGERSDRKYVVLAVAAVAQNISAPVVTTYHL